MRASVIEARIVSLVEQGRKVLECGLDVFLKLNRNRHDEFGREYQKWYREARALLERSRASTRAEFESHYGNNHYHDSSLETLTLHPPGTQGSGADAASLKRRVLAQLNLLSSLGAELRGRELDLREALSYEYVADEYEQAQVLLEAGFERAAGVIAGVALERHIRTLCERHGVDVKRSPSSKTRAEFSDYLASAKRSEVIDEVQRKLFDALYQVRKKCAHPEEPRREDVERLLRDGQQLAATVK